MAKKSTKSKAAASKASAVKKSGKSAKPKKVAVISHAATATRRNIPTAEYQDAAETQEAMDPRGPVTYGRARPLAQGETRARDGDKDPQLIWKGMRIKLTPDMMDNLQRDGQIEIGDAQLVWRGKDEQDWSDLVVNVPPLYIQEKIHPKVIIDDLVRQTKGAVEAKTDEPSLFGDLFADFNGLNDPEARTEFYQHSQHWSNRMILGDGLQVMASLAEREGLRGQVQCIYFDPPYGIKFNSNWQVSTQSRDVKDGKQTDISREPEQVKAFRDTWVDGIHSYLTYLRDRLTVARDLLTDSGSIFVQIGDENVHRVRALLDEVFGPENFVSEIVFAKTTGQSSNDLAGIVDYLIWFSRSRSSVKFRPVFKEKIEGEEGGTRYAISAKRAARGDNRLMTSSDLTSQSPGTRYEVQFEGDIFYPAGYWKTEQASMPRLLKSDRIERMGQTLRYVRFLNDYPVTPLTNLWSNIGGIQSRSDPKIYVVQTSTTAIQRCVLMTTDPGDLVLDPTCGSGTTATVAEQWGRRWITIDTSRVALALARTRLMSARYPFYYLADSKEGREQEQKITGAIQPDAPTTGDIRHGFIYERAPHITLKSIANNVEIDVIWEKWQHALESLRAELNSTLKQTWEEWQIPREAEGAWSESVKKAHAAWWEARNARQKEIDTSIAKAADVEYLYDRPYIDTSKVRVAGPFTVESLSPHRIVPSGNDEMADELKAMAGRRRRTRLATPAADFTAMVIEHLQTTGVQHMEKKNKITFDSVVGRATKRGEYIGAEAIYLERSQQRRAGILIGPEYGSLSKADLLAAANEAQRDRFDVLIACAFSFDAHASELSKLGPLPILKAKMSPDLLMAEELKNTGKGNLFVVFGEPDIDILEQDGDCLVVKINGIDVFDPNSGDIRSGDTKSIAAWFIDTDYNEESFFVRHAYFLGANDPYKSLKAALKAEIDKDAWETLYRDTSRPFVRPSSGKIAVKVINHFGDEVMKVFRI